MNRRNALARIAAAIAALVAAPRMLWARKPLVVPPYPGHLIAGEDLRVDELVTISTRDGKVYRWTSNATCDGAWDVTKRKAWYNGPPLGERYDEVLQRRDRELSRELTRISLSFYVPPWER